MFQKRSAGTAPFEGVRLEELNDGIAIRGKRMEIGFSASAEAAAAIGRIGRTEDVQFSPSGGLLAVAGFNENRLLILETEMSWGAEPRIVLQNPLQITSDALQRPPAFPA